jgi:hypothetical protein
MRAPDPPELLAARKLHAAGIAMYEAVTALGDVGSDDAIQHAKELLGAAKMVRRWDLALRRIAAEK